MKFRYFPNKKNKKSAEHKQFSFLFPDFFPSGIPVLTQYDGETAISNLSY